MSEQAPWSPFGDFQDRLPTEFENIAVEMLPTPKSYHLQAAPEADAWRHALGAGRALALGPDWALLLGDVDVVAVDQALADAGEAPLVEVTETRVWLALEGPAAVAALGMWATLDLALEAFPPGQALGARLGPLTAVIERTAPDRFVIAGPTASAPFLLEMLLDAAAAVQRAQAEEPGAR